MTLEIPTELEARLERAARERGTDAQAFALETLKNAFVEQQDVKTQEAKKQSAIDRLYGSLADSDFTVDEFLHERSEEARKEAGL